MHAHELCANKHLGWPLDLKLWSMFAKDCLEDIVLTPVQRTGVRIPPAFRISVIVSSALHNINFSRGGPRAVGVILWHHPNGRPQPIANGKLSSNLDSPILDALFALCCQTCRLNRRDNGSYRWVGSNRTLVVLGACAGAISSSFGQIETVAIQNLLPWNSRVCGQCRNNVKAILVSVRVLVAACCPV